MNGGFHAGCVVKVWIGNQAVLFERTPARGFNVVEMVGMRCAPDPLWRVDAVLSLFHGTIVSDQMHHAAIARQMHHTIPSAIATGLPVGSRRFMACRNAAIAARRRAISRSS